MSHEALTEVARQRERMAERALLPWWFWVLFALATTGLVGGTLIQEWIGAGIGAWTVLAPSILIYLAADRLIRRSRGIRLSSRTLRDYPSARFPGVVFVLVAVAGMLTVMLTAHAATVTATLALVVTVPLAVLAMAWMQARMRADIRAGRVRAA